MLFSSSPDYLQAIMSRFCVVVTLAMCCPMVTGVSLAQPVPASGRYTWFIACIPYVCRVYTWWLVSAGSSIWQVYLVYRLCTVCLQGIHLVAGINRLQHLVGVPG